MCVKMSVESLLSLNQNYTVVSLQKKYNIICEELNKIKNKTNEQNTINMCEHFIKVINKKNNQEKLSKSVCNDKFNINKYTLLGGVYPRHILSDKLRHPDAFDTTLECKLDDNHSKFMLNVNVHLYDLHINEEMEKILGKNPNFDIMTYLGNQIYDCLYKVWIGLSIKYTNYVTIKDLESEFGSGLRYIGNQTEESTIIF